MATTSLLILVIGGLTAGFIDAVAGGGALITIPALAVVLTPGVAAVAASKVAGTGAALMALYVFWSKGHMDWSKGVAFGFWVGIGAFAGSSAAPYLPVNVFKWMLVVLCPVLLAIIWKKDRWAAQAPVAISIPRSWYSNLMNPRFALAGLAVGAYDGFFGPAGGTFMFLALLFVVRIPILPAMAVSKFVNVVSGITALSNYTIKGYVHWHEGLIMTAGVLVGAFAGAHCATRSAAKIVRPVLALVVVLLLCHLILTK